jgi:hypothetical protein
MTRESALKQSGEIQLLVADHLHALDKLGYSWALMGGETEDDGATLRVTICLATRYATPKESVD